MDKYQSPPIKKTSLFQTLAPIVIVFTALMVTTGYLMLKLYMTTSLLVETTKRSFIQETNSKSELLEEFLVQRQNDVESLSSSSVFSGYYHSKALGMSREYGLLALASLIEAELKIRIDSIKDSGQSVFVSGIYYDYESGEVLAQSHDVDLKDWIDPDVFRKMIDSKSTSPILESVCGSTSCKTFISKPVVHEHLEKGLLILELSMDLLSQKVYAPDAYNHTADSGLADEKGRLIVGPSRLIGKNIAQIFDIPQDGINHELLVNSSSWNPNAEDKQSNLFIEKLHGIGWYAFKIIPGSVFGRGPSSSAWMTWFFLFLLSVILLIILVIRGLRLRNRMYEQLKYAHDELETRVHERTAELASANAELVTEVKERKQAQKKLYHQAQVLSSITDSILIVSRDMKIIYANQAARDIFSIDASDNNTNMLCYRVLKHESGVCDDCPVVGVLKDEKAHKSVTNYFSRDGQELWVYNNAFPFYDDSGELLGAILLSTDYSIRMEIEKTLNLAKEHAEAASISKSEFLMRMSHEIRTPMYAVLGTLDLILDSDAQIEHRDLLLNARISAESLQGILNDILDFSKVEAQRLTIECHEFSLRSVVESVMETLSIRAHEKRIEMVTEYLCDVPDNVSGDSLRIRQILTNLVGNSLKFTSHGDICLKVKVIDDDSGKASFLFDVTDSGIGIAPDKLENIFDPFAQAEGFIARTYGGTGLGLAITKSLVELMGGSIWVESEIGKGSSFKFMLPLEVSQNDSDSIDRCEVMAEGDKALIIDDNQKSAESLRLNLESAGFNVSVESNLESSEQVVSRILETGIPFRFIFIDYEMPRMSGLDIIRRLPEMKDTKLVFMAYPSELAAIHQAKTLGATLFLAKPFKLRDIFNLFETNSYVSRPMDFLASVDLNYISPERTDESLSLPRSILLAEDNAVNQKLIQRTLERKNFKVRIANNGKEAVEAVKVENFDLILMDVQMPVMDGLNATRIIRDYERQINRRTPIVAMTAHAFQQTQDVCREAGMDYYFSKPISGKNLIEKIETILKKSPGTKSTSD